MLFYIKYQCDIISLQVECIKQIFELCTHIQNISDKADFIISFNFKVKRLDLTTQQHIRYIKYVQTFIHDVSIHTQYLTSNCVIRYPSTVRT